jgi:hypothetical protein
MMAKQQRRWGRTVINTVIHRMSWRRFIASQMKDTPSQKTAVNQVTQKKKGKTEPNDEYRLFRLGENLIDECKTSPRSATSSVTLSVEWKWCFSRIQHSFFGDRSRGPYLVSRPPGPYPGSLTRLSFVTKVLSPD